MKETTRNVESQLVSEVKHNTKLYGFLTKYKYLYLDKDKKLVGTRMPRVLGVGRMRMSTKKILREAGMQHAQFE